MAKTLMSLLVAVCFVVGCGGATVGSSNQQTVSAWTGTYTGQLDFKGCPSTSPCGGDTITLTLTQPSVGLNEFSSSLTVSGTDNTTNAQFSGTGDALETNPAPAGPGSQQTNASLQISLGDNLSFGGSGSSSTSAPVVMQTVAVYNAVQSNGTWIRGALYLGTLSRQ